MVHGRARVHECDEDVVGQVREEGDGKFELVALAAGARKILMAS